MATATPNPREADKVLQLNDGLIITSSEYTYTSNGPDHQHTTVLQQDSDYASTWDFSMLLVDPADHNSRHVSMANRPLPPPPVPPRLIIDTTLPLEDQMWYHGAMNAAEAEIILSEHEDFSFLVRKSTRNPDWYALSIRNSETNYDIDGEQFLHFRIKKNGDNTFDVGSTQFESIPKFIECCTQHNFMISMIGYGGSYTLTYPVIKQ